MSDGSDGAGWDAESDTARPDDPAAGSVSWQDDVVIDTSFMAETDQPGYYDANGERLSLTGEVERAADHDPAAPATVGEASPTHDDAGAGAPDDDAATRSLTLVDDSDTPAGRDDDWEPWGSGGMDDPDSAGDRPGEADGLPIDQTDRHAGDQVGAAAGASGVILARTLLEQLRVAIDSLEHSTAPLAPDPRAELAIGSVAEIGQILDALPSEAIEADRLAELTRLAEDLTGRDYDIRALQRFAQERETILNLATEVRQQRDVIDQIRSVVAQSQL